jgi:hypothetical protein
MKTRKNVSGLAGIAGTVLAVLFVVLFPGGCLSPLDPSGGNGSIRITMPGGGAALTAISNKDALSYELFFSGPEGRTEGRSAQLGETVTIRVIPGRWTVTVKAFDPANLSTPKAVGESSLEVQAGTNNNASVKLAVYSEVSTFAELKAAVETGDDDDFIVVKGDITATDYIDLNADKTVTIVADGDCTISRDGTYTGAMLGVHGGHLVLGSPAYTGKLTLDGAGVSTPGHLVLNTFSFTMNSGVLKNNDGGGVSNSGTFTMNGGTISGNATTIQGGGVDNAGTFTMNGGTIMENSTGGSGGGVYVYNAGTFTMRGGTIKGNEAGAKGGGVYVLDSANFSKTGGTIYGGDAAVGLKNAAGSDGHAVYSDAIYFRNTTVTVGEVLSLAGGYYSGSWPEYEVPAGGSVIYVGTAAELAAIIGDITDPAKNYSANAYVLTADIDLGSFGPWTPIGKAAAVDSYGTPTGDGHEPFKGYFYGEGRRILGLQLPAGSAHKMIGLFGYTNGARIRNLVVELAAGTISLSAMGTSVLHGGGIAGWSADTDIINCGVYSTGTITITGTLGYSLGIGGIAGAISGTGTISGSYASLNFVVSNSGTHLDVGGIVKGGDVSSLVENCYFAGAISVSGTSNARLGGIAVGNVDTAACYAAGTLSNTNNITGGYLATGGIYAGHNRSVTNSAALQSAVSDNSNRLGRVQNYEEAAGTPTITLTNNYAYSGMTLNGNTVADNATDPEDSQNGLGKSAAALKAQSTYLTDLGWDFTDVWEMGPSSYPYPIFKWQKGTVYIPFGFAVLP